ncbi:L,D-transpeptidase [Beijerinckia sp. L45]|uniref:L,D-transpeptidase n=1 Tax=Beijerinckia sp. L45 TaxID=1641855 RepID=UPI00131D0F2F|nr:L,D-transpeptidase [Beijerinckia sp. L45]
MSRRLWVAACLVAGVVTSIASPAFAQYPGYGAYDTDPYQTRQHDYGSGYNGGFSYERPVYPSYPDDQAPRARAPQGYAPPPYADAYPDPSETDPRNGAASGPPSDYDLGDTASHKTAQVVPNPTHQAPGTLVVDTATKHLYLVKADGEAIQYGIGVGREGFAWKGTATVQRKAEWPAWVPPSDMLKRRPDLPRRMEGGMENPLGARALYLFQGNKDTMFRIHGTNEPDTIGKAVSSGCIRMMNADVIDLYQRVPVGAKVVVL